MLGISRLKKPWNSQIWTTIVLWQNRRKHGDVLFQFRVIVVSSSCHVRFMVSCSFLVRLMTATMMICKSGTALNLESWKHVISTSENLNNMTKRGNLNMNYLSYFFRLGGKTNSVITIQCRRRRLAQLWSLRNYCTAVVHVYIYIERERDGYKYDINTLAVARSRLSVSPK
jgi:hypothetical protein